MADTPPTPTPTVAAPADTVESTALPTDALTGWAAWQNVENIEGPANLNRADRLLNDALAILGP
jgi:hypothetical protein